MNVRLKLLLAGSDSNVAAGEILTVAGEVGTQVGVMNSDVFTGGGGIETPSPNENDYAVLEQQLLENLLEQGLVSLQAEIMQGTVLIKESLGLDEVMVEEQVNKISEPSDEAVLRMTVIVKALTYRESDLRAIASLILTSSQPESMLPLDESINIDQKGEIIVDDLEQALWTMKASRLLMPEWNQDTATTELAGKTVSDANLIFSALFSQSEPARIKLITRWWPRLPFLPTQIHFINGASS